ncbi:MULTISPECIES: calcium/sodium antiporter [unclassified Coleofasciculus]|uniref:calcium/sodium antiporter n=1 Tax=unclassified Coleofasciculus TaxID=2692782 RepID=UPI0018818522|nr:MULTISPECIES: calcium/sodium antiporter [unclassified Coleofasciculus]MBE9125673.1 calcium/sodium antiporter [Coleofasciculus sp. LEGE 07081]MBE9148828.1 calcium/sodium antiporter [Coleofasciculus sp. LEGE 07092]
MDTITLLLFITGVFLLVAGAEILVRGASRLAVTAGLSPLVVGLTVVAYGTSAPELAVSVQSSYAGQADIATGNVVGSNIANILLILGSSAAVAPLIVSRQLVRLDVPLMAGLSFLVLLMGLDGRLGKFDGIVLCIGAIAYTFFTVYQGRRESQNSTEELTQAQRNRRSRQGIKQIAPQLGLIIIGLGMLVLGANWLISGAVVLARTFGVSELIIGLTIVAVGTSLPEIATSIIAGIRGERDIAVGNAIGSNIFNILLVLGLSSLVAPNGVPIAKPALNFDLPVMIAVAVACLPIFFTGYRIARWEGFLFLAYYAAYTMYLFLNATEHQALAEFSIIMIVFVMPLTVVTLAILAIRAVRKT